MAMKKKIMIIISVLAIFGCFYAVRETWFRKYLADAESLYAEGKTDEALADFLFASALDENGSDESMKVRRAEIFLENKELDAAERELLPAAAGKTKNYEVYELLGKVESARGNHLKADSYFVKAYVFNPTMEKFLQRIGNMVRSGDFAGAEAALRAKRGAEDNAEIDYYLALIAFNGTDSLPDLSALEEDRYAAAARMMEDFYDDAASGASRNPDYVLVRKADLFNRIRETDFAFADADLVLRRNAGYPDALVVRGETFVIEDDFAAAADAFEKCIAIDINNQKAYAWLAKIYKELGREEEAAACEEKLGYLNN